MADLMPNLAPHSDAHLHPHPHPHSHPHEEEEDVCRVCRVEGDEADPLVHPCKCSGSVRYVHPDCLKQWLAQTGKKHCEICGHKYAFTKIYPEQLPSSIPVAVFIRQTLWWLLRRQILIARCCLVVITWLIFLPSMNMFSLRGLLWATDHIGYRASDKAASVILNDTIANVTTAIVNGATHVISTSVLNGTTHIAVNVTRDLLSNSTKESPNSQDASMTITEYARMMFQKWLKGDENSAVSYVLRGQILTISLAAVLFGLILLREWITQHNWQEHARPQVVEEGEVNPDEWIVMNGIARKTSEVVAALRRMKGQARARRRAQRPVSLDEQGTKSFIELAQAQREAKVKGTAESLEILRRRLDMKRSQETLDALRRQLEAEKEKKRSGTVEGAEVDGDGISALEQQVNMLEQKLLRRAALTETLESAARTENEPPQQPEATGATAFANALDEYRKAHRLAERRTERIMERQLQERAQGLSGNSSTGDAQLDHLLRDLQDDIVIPKHWTEEEAEESDAGPSRPKLDRVGTGLGEDETASKSGGSISMDGSSGSKRGSSESDNVAYTAPELLKGKGKAKEDAGGGNADEDEDEDGFGLGSGSEDKTRVGEVSSSIEGEIPLFLPSSLDRDLTPSPISSPTRPGSPAPWRDPTDDEDNIVLTRRAAALQHARRIQQGEPLPWADLTDIGGENGEQRNAGDDAEWEDEPAAVEGPEFREIRDIIQNIPAAGAGGLQGLDVRPVEVEFIDELEEEPWDREDWNGILEVIGFVGPLHGLLQNVLFGIIILGAAVFIFVGLPMIIGKVALSIDLIRFALSVSARTLYLIRKITDPIVDIVFEIVKEVLVLPVLSSVGAAEKIVASKLGLEGSGPSSEMFHHITSLFSLSPSTPSTPSALTSAGARNKYLTLLGDGLAWIGQHAYDAYSRYIEAKHSIAASTAVSDRIWCAVTGYGVVGGVIALVALAGEAGGGISREVARSLKEHAMFFKLAFFMVLELGAFPLGLGLMIDACTVPLWPGATLIGRLERLSQSPFGVMFIDWLVGTMFMYQFATLLSHIRTLCRPGTLFFIRDPSDPNYSPVKDIVEKSALSQLRKLSTSAIMYSVVVFTLFGAVSWTLAWMPFVKLFPLRIDPTFGPLTSIPFDLLFLHLVVPPTITLIRPRHRLQVVLTAWWRWTIRLFNLTALMAIRRPGWDATPSRASQKLETIWPVLDPIFQFMFGKYDSASTKSRVPASDQVILLPPIQRRAEGGVFISLTAEGAPLNPQDKLRLLKQDKRAREAGRDPKRDYEVITLPAFWRTRIHAFIGATLGMGALVIGGVVLGPLVVGRTALGWDMGKGLHDGYTWLAGAYIIHLSLTLGLSARRFILSTGKAARLRRSGRSTRIKRNVMRFLAAGYGLVMVYGLTPLCVGLIWEIYGSAFGIRKGRTVIHFWDTWALGAILCSLFLGLGTSFARFRPDRASFMDLLKARFNNPTPKDFASTNVIVLPALGYLSIPLFAPFFVAFVAALASGRRYDDEVYHGMFLAVIPLLLRVFAAALLRRHLSNGWGSMRQQMIDAEYVVEERVENYEPAPVAEAHDEKDKSKSKNNQKRDGEEVTQRGEAGNEPLDVIAAAAAAALGVADADDDDADAEEGEEEWVDEVGDDGDEDDE